MRPSSPLLDSVRDQFEDYDQLAKDFTRVFLNMEPSCLANAQLFDVVFMVGQSKQKARFIGVRAILGVRSRVFQVNKNTLTFALNGNEQLYLSTIGNAVRHTNWFRIASSSCCRTIGSTSTDTYVTAKWRLSTFEKF